LSFLSTNKIYLLSTAILCLVDLMCFKVLSILTYKSVILAFNKAMVD